MKANILQSQRALCVALSLLLLSAVGWTNVNAESIAFANANMENVSIGHRNTLNMSYGIPSVITTPVSKNGNDVVSGGNVVDDGGSSITARGICYGSNPNPDLSGSYTHTEDGTGTGIFTSVIGASVTGTIYVRAYATNANGTAYGEELTVNVDYYRLPRFEYNGLTYVVAPDPQSSSTEFISFSAASNYCENLTAYGYSDWVMPNISELETMWQNRTAIGGFIQGTSTNPMCYHSSTYYGSTGHYKLVWLTGGRVQNANLENVGMTTATSGGVTATFRCHVRPVRMEIFLPIVTTDSVTNITHNSAVFGGNVTDDGGVAVTARGICWGTSPNPTISDGFQIGSGIGHFTTSYSGLTPGTQYYVRAYATNIVGTAYGNVVSFTTPPTSIPTVTTNSVYDITTTTAKSGGNVISNGGLSLTERGICWSTNHNPTTYNSHISDYYISWSQYNSGSYTLTMTGLIPGTIYYVRAYASNSEGTAYGDEVSFMTTSPPTVTTNNVTNITPNSATCGGNVTAEGSGTVTARGVCWSTSPNPTISNNHTNNGTGMGSFTSNITGLEQNTSYYVRAYATNSEGTAYGEELHFTTTKLLDVTTNNVTYITQTSATCGGYVTAYNGMTVTDRGVCWSTTNQTPTISDSHTSSGTGTGSFTSNLTGLSQNTTYYVRAYAICNGGTAYGETKQFKTTKFEYRISEGGVVATSAGGYFYDSGGPNNDYHDNEHYVITFTSNQGTGTKIQMMFTYFSLCDDNLVIYDGMNTSAPQIGTYSFTHSPGTVTATNSDGALTFVFISNGECYESGWEATISIVTPNYYIETSANPSYGGTISGGGYFDYGQNCTLTATPNSGYTFTNWTENGNVVSTNPYYSFTVNGNRNLVANFVETSANMCNLVFELMDSYGDGWNGNSLNVSFSDGSPSQSLTFNSGSNAEYVIAAGNGAIVTLTWTSGQWTSECSFKVKYEVGPIIYQGSNPSSGFSYNFQMDCSSSNNPIVFADSNVKALCVSNWDTNGNGELSYNEAAMVTSLGSMFNNQANITSFNELQYFVSLSSIGSNGFSGCSNLNSITLPNSITSIGNNAFFGCSSLTSIVIPQSVTSIGSEAFRDCPGLTQMKVNSTNAVYDSRNNCNGIVETATNKLVYGCKNTYIPNSVTSIGGAFDGCSSLTSITIPSSVTSIGNYAFYGCSSLASMTVLAETPPVLGTSVFANVNATIPISVPCGTSGTYQAANGWNAFNNYVESCNYTISVTVHPTGGGSVNGAGIYQNGATCTLIATPSEGYTFDGWIENGTTVSTNAIYSFEVNGNRSLVANFNPSTVLQVYALYHYPDSNPNTQYVKVYWDEIATARSIEDFESSDFSLYDWRMDSNNPWSITTAQPYEGSYCMKSGGAGVNNVVSNMTITVNIPADGQMSFFGKISCESNWDFGIFYIDGVQMGRYSGTSDWEMYSFDITAGIHSFQWSYTKDSSVNSNDDCFYVDYITFLSAPESVGSETHISLFNADERVFNDERTLKQYRVYRDTQNENEMVVVADNITQHEYLDTEWPNLSPGIYRYGIYDLSDSNADIVWSNYAEKALYQITASAVPLAGGSISGMGTYNQGMTCTLTATANDGYTFSSWTENDEVVSTNATYPFVVYSNRSLIANFVPIGNHWSPENPDAYSLTMALTGIIQIDGIEQFSNQLEIGAFCNGECRGSQMASEFFLTNRYLVQLSIAGEIGDILTFKLYDHGTAQELNLTSPAPVTFIADGYGTPIDPYVLNFTSAFEISATSSPEGAGTVTGAGSYIGGTNCTLVAEANSGFQFLNWTKDGVVVSTESSYSFTVTQSASFVAHFQYVHTQALSNGWNWWSTYIEQNDPNGLTMLENSLGGNGIRILSKNNGYVDQFEYNGSNMWFGNLTTLTNEQMYMVRTNTACEASMTGNLASFAQHPITINSGWNWIGFPSNESISVATALSGFTPEANDQIKSKNNGYSTYVVYGTTALWFGNLNTLEPGQGYMYKSNSNNAKTLTFQGGRGESLAENVTTEGNTFSPKGADYAHNMTITAVVELEGDELRSEDYELAAFVGDECRGSVKLMYVEPLDRYLAFLLAYGETEEPLRFALTDGIHHIWSDDELVYNNDGSIGTPTSPTVIHFGTLGVSENGLDKVRVFPNPSSDVFNVERKGMRKVKVVNAYGQVIYDMEANNDLVQINLGNHASGIYLLRIVTEKGITTQLIIKK